jgi:hypothetical protein
MKTTSVLTVPETVGGETVGGFSGTADETLGADGEKVRRIADTGGFSGTADETLGADGEKVRRIADTVPHPGNVDNRNDIKSISEQNRNKSFIFCLSQFAARFQRLHR